MSWFALGCLIESGRCLQSQVDTFGLCSVENPSATLTECARVCRDDGRVLLLEHGQTKSWGWLARYLDSGASQHARDWGCWWNRDIHALLAASGLSVVSHEVRHFGTTHIVIARPSSVAADKK